MNIWYIFVPCFVGLLEGNIAYRTWRLYSDVLSWVETQELGTPVKNKRRYFCYRRITASGIPFISSQFFLTFEFTVLVLEFGVWTIDSRRLVESSSPNVYWDVESETGRGGWFEADGFPTPSQCWPGRETGRKYYRPVCVYRHWWGSCSPDHHQTENILPNMEWKFPIRSASGNQLRPDCVSRCCHTTRWFCG